MVICPKILPFCSYISEIRSYLKNVQGNRLLQNEDQIGNIIITKVDSNIYSIDIESMDLKHGYNYPLVSTILGRVLIAPRIRYYTPARTYSGESRKYEIFGRCKCPMSIDNSDIQEGRNTQCTSRVISSSDCLLSFAGKTISTVCSNIVDSVEVNATISNSMYEYPETYIFVDQDFRSVISEDPTDIGIILDDSPLRVSDSVTFGKIKYKNDTVQDFMIQGSFDMVGSTSDVLSEIHPKVESTLLSCNNDNYEFKYRNTFLPEEKGIIKMNSSNIICGYNADGAPLSVHNISRDFSVLAAQNGYVIIRKCIMRAYDGQNSRIVNETYIFCGYREYYITLYNCSLKTGSSTKINSRYLMLIPNNPNAKGFIKRSANDSENFQVMSLGFNEKLQACFSIPAAEVECSYTDVIAVSISYPKPSSIYCMTPINPGLSFKIACIVRKSGVPVGTYYFPEVNNVTSYFKKLESSTPSDIVLRDDSGNLLESIFKSVKSNFVSFSEGVSSFSMSQVLYSTIRFVISVMLLFSLMSMVKYIISKILSYNTVVSKRGSGKRNKKNDYEMAKTDQNDTIEVLYRRDDISYDKKKDKRSSKRKDNF